MSTSSQPRKPSELQEAGEQPDNENANGDDTYTTDISETDDDGKTVREAEVRSDDLSETKAGEGGKS
ncbi:MULTISPECIES: hypothetical protein [unclassified Caballeronia]|uniref:hypothetical protein n=1 Tax=unclassified Caballeronia TaxID=2646786 RepID=UPI00285CAF9F|nr:MULTISPECIES: hypothetical protein [unclassified Caballeronia]MDR5752240.1 hypothetical protein [Caballeronia sp. LZ024]MDR5841757.1 hypothetical protein [Caballeronia sp. LZ031]